MLLIVGRKARLQTATAEESGFGPYYGPSAPCPGEAARERFTMPLGRSRFCNHHTAAGVSGRESPVHPAPLWRASWRRHYALRKVVDSYSAVLNAIPALSSQRTPKRELARNP